MSPKTLLALAAALILVPAAYAQGPYSSYYGPYYSQDQLPWHGYVLGGFSQPVGNANNVLQGGWDVGGGAIYRPSGSPLALRLELNYSSNNATDQTLSQGAQQTGLAVTGGWADLWSATVNAELRFPLGKGIYGYVVGGVGGYYTQLNIQGYGGYGYVCSWWGGCYVGPGWGTVYNDTTKFGWNAGAGASFQLRNGMVMFVEARYNAVQLSQTLAYVPVTVGIRF